MPGLRLPSLRTEWIVGGAIVIVLGSWLGVGINRARLAARESSCDGHVFALTIALLNYRHDHGQFPPAVVRDPDGRALHSWRVLILPYLGYSEEYADYHLDEPWNSPSNLKLVDRMPAIFTCPNCPHPSNTNYFLAIDSGLVRTSIVPNGAGRLQHASDDDQPLDIPPRVIVIEDNSRKIPWTEPRDLSAHELGQWRAQGCDPSGCAYGLSDRGRGRGFKGLTRVQVAK